MIDGIKSVIHQLSERSREAGPASPWNAPLSKANLEKRVSAVFQEMGWKGVSEGVWEWLVHAIKKWVVAWLIQEAAPLTQLGNASAFAGNVEKTFREQLQLPADLVTRMNQPGYSQAREGNPQNWTAGSFRVNGGETLVFESEEEGRDLLKTRVRREIVSATAPLFKFFVQDPERVRHLFDAARQTMFAINQKYGVDYSLGATHRFSPISFQENRNKPQHWAVSQSIAIPVVTGKSVVGFLNVSVTYQMHRVQIGYKIDSVRVEPSFNQDPR